MHVWLDGALVSKDEAKISVFDHGFLYGDGIFEGIRVYEGMIFKLQRHFQWISILPLAGVIALGEPDTLPFNNINGRDYLYHNFRKFERMASPGSLLFSGWNCVA